MTDSPFGKSNPMDIQDDVIKPVNFTGVPLDEFLETHETVLTHQLPPTEVGGLFLSSVVERLKADSLPKDSVL